MALGAAAVAPRGTAENELKLSLSMGEENARNSIGLISIPGSWILQVYSVFL